MLKWRMIRCFVVYRNRLDFERSPGEMFTDMYREQGYLWFVTPAGIVRYDGAELNYEGEGWIGHDSHVESRGQHMGVDDYRNCPGYFLNHFPFPDDHWKPLIHYFAL